MTTLLHPLTQARLAEWSEDPDVLGVLLVGSKSRGHADARSDDDLEVLLRPEAFARLAPEACGVFLFETTPMPKLIYDVQLTSLESLIAKAASPLDLDRWPYERAHVLFDRTGTVAAAVAAAGAMPAGFRQTRLQHAAIDLWAASGRADKTLSRGFGAAGRLIVARGARALARVLFALEHRWVPLDHWLEAELATLADPAGAAPCLVRALNEAEPAALREALERLGPALEAEGFPGPEGRRDLFFTLVHPSRAAERAVHGLF